MSGHIRITQRFVAVIAMYTMAFATVMGVSLWGLMSARDSLKTVHDDAMKPVLLAGESIDKIVQNRLQILLAFQHAPDGPLASIHTHPTKIHVEAIVANRAEANKMFKDMESSVAGRSAEAAREIKALVEETSAASSALQEQARELSTLAASFKLDQHGGSRSPQTMARLH
jgi:CHASE3 domain sensor protein